MPKWPSGWATPVDLEAQDFPLHQGNAFNEQQKGCLDRTNIFGWLFANIIVKNLGRLEYFWCETAEKK